MEAQKFTVVASFGPRGKLVVPVPFDPDRVWTPKDQHHVHGTIDGRGIRAVLENDGGQWGFALGPAALTGCGIKPGDQLVVAVQPEGPQRDDLAPDLAAALEANPQAGTFFDSLAQFYRRAYLRWIDATKRSPQLRAERIDEVVRLLSAGIKERPKS